VILITPRGADEALEAKRKIRTLTIEECEPTLRLAILKRGHLPTEKSWHESQALHLRMKRSGESGESSIDSGAS